MFVFSLTPKDAQVGFEIMNLNIPMGGKEDLGAAGLIERFMKEEAVQSIRYCREVSRGKDRRIFGSDHHVRTWVTGAVSVLGRDREADCRGWHGC